MLLCVSLSSFDLDLILLCLADSSLTSFKRLIIEIFGIIQDDIHPPFEAELR